MRPSRFLASTGVRLAVVQTVLLITAFAVAGSLTKVTVTYIYRHDLRERIQGEVATLTARFPSGGVADVAAAVARAEHRPGGLEYRLEQPGGRRLSGDLPPTGAPLGWTKLDWDDAVVPGRPYQDILVYTARLPDGSVLTVGQDLTDESKLRHALKDTLFWCGAAGAAVGLVLAWLLARGPLRRVEGVVAAARAVSAGRMQVRAPRRAALVGDDIDELAASFNAMLDEIAALVERVRWVSTDIAHDLRTPLTHVRQKLERIRRSAAGQPALLEAAREVEADIDDVMRMFDAMLRLAEIECGPGAARLVPVDLAEIAGRVADAYRPDVEASGRTLTVSLQPAPAAGDADLIAQALANLIDNALRHTPPGASIEVSAGPGADGPSLSVADDGPGIPADRREAVLRPFHRLEASRTTPGTGLGLAIVAAVASRHGATLALDDARPGLRVSLAFQQPQACAGGGLSRDPEPAAV